MRLKDYTFVLLYYIFYTIQTGQIFWGVYTDNGRIAAEFWMIMLTHIPG